MDICRDVVNQSFQVIVFVILFRTNVKALLRPAKNFK